LLRQARAQSNWSAINQQLAIRFERKSGVTNNLEIFSFGPQLQLLIFRIQIFSIDWNFRVAVTDNE
jgi:hypothetical protein